MTVTITRDKCPRYLLSLALAAAVLLSPQGKSDAGLSIDIVKAPRKLPIAVMELTGPYGSQISEVISEDLSLSGLFEPLDPETFIERPGQKFSKVHWAGTGAEAVLKGEVVAAEDLIVRVTLYDVVEGRPVMAKQYKATRELLRPLAHAVSNDIYRHITGKEGIFRTRIVYTTLKDGQAGMHLADWDGKRGRELPVKARSLMAPRWHWSGKSILYSAQRERSWNIHRIHLSSMKEEPLIQEKGTNIAGGFFPEGDRFTFSSSKDGTPDIYTYYIHRKKLSKLTRDYGIEVSPAVSPDGESIAYVSDRTGSPQIYTMDKFGYNKDRLTYEGRYNTSPSWSPDGKTIAFSGWKEDSNQIFTIRTDGRGLRQLTGEGNNEEPSLSPDGRFIVFTSDREGSKAIYMMRASGEEQRRISPPGVRASSPRWSPN
ncbi:MAG: Tol-Pal system beta propeller repeat protein TolB [Thermodesulfovibrionales bacterium]|nr:Tol-Pal system beta propeller repeat protein TolB [Thermodesulfovibrionales bacterium]